MMQVAVMASDSRPPVRDVCLHRLCDPEGGALMRAELAQRPRLYYAGADLPEFHLGWHIVRLPKGPPYLPQFWRVLLEADAAEDLLFLEDDVWIVHDGIRKIAALEVPDWAGVLSLFDWHNEATGKAGMLELPRGRVFMGAQALKVPARALRRLQHLARAEVLLPDPRSSKPAHLAGDPRWTSASDRAVNSWDNWIGAAVELLGLSSALYAPSLVQHLGAKYSAIFPDHHHGPVADNVPEPWPKIAWEEFDARHWCDFHGTWHAEASICPRIS